jgi:hypothetical protein
MAGERRDVAQMRILEKNLELRRKQEIHEIEERKNTHINELMKKHEKAFAEIKNYYNDITHNNLDLIKTLKVIAVPTSRAPENTSHTCSYPVSSAFISDASVAGLSHS